MTKERDKCAPVRDRPGTLPETSDARVRVSLSPFLEERGRVEKRRRVEIPYPQNRAKIEGGWGELSPPRLVCLELSL
jgi:hypothetical protein